MNCHTVSMSCSVRFARLPISSRLIRASCFLVIIISLVLRVCTYMHTRCIVFFLYKIINMHPFQDISWITWAWCYVAVWWNDKWQANWEGAKIVYGDTDSVFVGRRRWSADGDVRLCASTLESDKKQPEFDGLRLFVVDMFSWIHFSFRYHYPLQCNRVTILAYVEVQLKGYSLEEAFQTGRQICAEVSWRFDGGFWFWKMKSVANLQSLNWQHHLYINIRCYLPRLVNFWVMGVTVDKALRKVLPF